MSGNWPVVLFCVVVVAAQLVGRRALSRLSPDQKLSVIESASKMPWALVAMALLYGAYVWFDGQLGHPMWMLSTLMLTMLVVAIVSIVVRTYRMKALRLPANYVWTVTGARLAIFVTFGWIFGSMYLDLRDIHHKTDQVMKQANEAIHQLKRE